VRRRFVDLAVAAVVLGVMQAVVETTLLAWQHRDLLLAPYRFFPTHAYDAFAKLWFLLADRIALPLLLQDFVGQGFAPKLALAPELLAINIAMATLVAIALTPVAGLFGLGRGRRAGRALAVVVAACLAMHLATWAGAFHLPRSSPQRKSYARWRATCSRVEPAAPWPCSRFRPQRPDCC
jgi:hypothetical protein